MATYYIEQFADETWASVSKSFARWITEQGASARIGWSEGESLTLEPALQFFCLNIPDHLGDKSDLVCGWAQSTNRIWGLERNGRITFSHDPELVVELPEPKDAKIPRWLT